MAIWDTLAELRSKHWVFWLLTGANLLGIGFGYYYYWDVGQFDPASIYYEHPGWWAFVADSPNAVLLMQISLTWWYFGRGRSAVLDSLAFVHMVYVGLWTTLLFSLYPDQLGTFEWGSTNNILFFSHMGMPLEALLLVSPLLRDSRSWRLMGGLGAWAMLNLFLDYGPFELRPAPFVEVGPELAMGSVLLMGLAYGSWAVLHVMRGARPDPAS